MVLLCINVYQCVSVRPRACACVCMCAGASHPLTPAAVAHKARERRACSHGNALIDPRALLASPTRPSAGMLLPDERDMSMNTEFGAVANSVTCSGNVLFSASVTVRVSSLLGPQCGYTTHAHQIPWQKMNVIKHVYVVRGISHILHHTPSITYLLLHPVWGHHQHWKQRNYLQQRERQPRLLLDPEAAAAEHLSPRGARRPPRQTPAHRRYRTRLPSHRQRRSWALL